MADLLAVLSNSATSLAAHRTAAATASHNLQNVNTPGYARQRAELRNNAPAMISNGLYIGRGAEAVRVNQARDRYLESQVPTTYARSLRSRSEAEVLESVHVLDASHPHNVSASLSALFNQLRLLSQNPSDTSLRDSVVDSSRTLANAFNQSSQAIEQARQGVDAQLGGVITEANQLAAEVAELNSQVRVARVTANAEPNDLLDLRQKAADRLAELVGATPVPDKNGNLTLTLPQGGALVTGDRAARLILTSDPDNNGHPKLQLVTTGGGSTQTLLARQLGGQLGGLFDARDGALRKAMDELDTLARQVSTQMNALHRAGVGLDGSTANDLFDVGTLPPGGEAARIKVSAPVEASSGALATAGADSRPGDNTVVRQLLLLERSASFGGGVEPMQAASAISGSFGARARRVRALADHEGALRTHLEGLRDSASGVSVDEELVEMTKAQRAYDAVAKVIKTTDEMLDTLLKLK